MSQVFHLYSYVKCSFDHHGIPHRYEAILIDYALKEDYGPFPYIRLAP